MDSDLCIDKFQFLAQFSEDHLPHPVVSTLILFLGLFPTFAYYVINRFVSITTLTIVNIIIIITTYLIKQNTSSSCILYINYLIYEWLIER